MFSLFCLEGSLVEASQALLLTSGALHYTPNSTNILEGHKASFVHLGPVGHILPCTVGSHGVAAGYSLCFVSGVSGKWTWKWLKFTSSFADSELGPQLSHWGLLRRVGECRSLRDMCPAEMEGVVLRTLSQHSQYLYLLLSVIIVTLSPLIPAQQPPFPPTTANHWHGCFCQTASKLLSISLL